MEKMGSRRPPPVIATKPRSLEYNILLLTPSSAICDEPETCVIVFNQSLPSNTDIFVKFSGVVKSTFAWTDIINPTTLSFVVPFHIPVGEAKLSIHAGAEQKILCDFNKPFVFKSKVDHVQDLLESSVDPLSFMSSIFGNNEKDLCAVDLKLESVFRLKLPEYLNVLKSSRKSLDSSINLQSLSKNPTLLHFSARHGLVKLCTALLECPGAQEALQIYNCEGHTPRSLATSFGNIDLSEMLQQDEDMYESMASDIYGTLKEDAPEMLGNKVDNFQEDDDVYITMQASAPNDYTAGDTYVTMKSPEGKTTAPNKSLKHHHATSFDSFSTNQYLNEKLSVSSNFLKQTNNVRNHISTSSVNKPKKAHSFDTDDSTFGISLSNGPSLHNINLKDEYSPSQFKCGIYDVPPSKLYEQGADNEGNYVVSSSNQKGDDESMNNENGNLYDELPTRFNQYDDKHDDLYDVPANLQQNKYIGSSEESTNVCDVPTHQQGVYNEEGYGNLSDQETDNLYDVPLKPQSYQKGFQSSRNENVINAPTQLATNVYGYNEKFSTYNMDHELYDTPPSNSGDIYDVPPSNSGDIYDVPPSNSGDIYDTPPSNSGDIYDVPPSNSGDIYDVPPSNSGDIYDTPPSNSGDIYDTPPSNSGDIYDVPPSNSGDIYDVPPSNRRERFDTPPSNSGEIYDTPPSNCRDGFDTPPSNSEEIYDVPQPRGNVTLSDTKHGKPLPQLPNNISDGNNQINKYCEETKHSPFPSRKQKHLNSQQSNRHGKAMPVPPAILPRERTDPVSKSTNPKLRSRR